MKALLQINASIFADGSQSTYVRDFLRFIGIESVHFVYAEGLGMGSERKDAALRDAHDTISQLTTAAAVAA
jgi:FMN-dependent NADH-azoreductase